MNGYSVLLIWAGLGCLVIAWAVQVMPGYPKLDETSKGALGLVYAACFVLGPAFIAYWIGLGVVLTVKFLLRGIGEKS